jgi:hypothetical protein
MTEYVSTNARTFKQPPSDGSIRHVFEPYLNMNPHPEMLLPAYYSGRNLAESYYLAIPRLSWQNTVLGDPLCSLGKP